MVTIALGQLNVTVGDLDGNVERLAQVAADATSAAADVVAFPELAITGYPPEDLVLKPALQDHVQQAVPEVVVVRPVACEAFLFEQHAGDRRQAH